VISTIISHNIIVNDEIKNISTKVGLSMKKLTNVVLKVNGGDINC